ncbi:MAG TPA: glycosyl hydrolase family 65 protein [Jatrophihabitans sp.]|nr:glycosyl hydrolase family 65 protein [Jatrophihabitans sp.]
MRRPRLVLATIACFALALLTPALAAADSSASTPAASSAGAYLLTATNRGSSYAPTFTGNGYLGVRVPAAGQGYAAGTVPAQSEVAGFYAQPPGDVQQRANIPTWSTLGFGDGTDNFALNSGTVTGWRQQLNLHDGVITTSARWQAPDGHVADLKYQVFTDRARKYVGTVRLTVTPHWTGKLSVTDLIDGTPATLTSAVTRGWNTSNHAIWESVRTVGTGIVAGLASRVGITGAGTQTVEKVTPADAQSVGQRISFTVHSGHGYSATKYVGVVTSTEASNPLQVARNRAAQAASAGFTALHSEDAGAWAQLWRGRIDVLGRPALATEVNASEFYLWSSTRAGLNWSVSPAGLSSNGYDGHIFWDAETWMHPTLLAQHPELAAGMDAYRFNRLHAAQQHAAATGYRGARFPWESALDGTEQIPPPVSVNSEGLYEQHITADIALAQWQYYLATGDRSWLASRGWPVISNAAKFWASRVTRSADGRYHINHVTGPDEENPNVNDEAYTNVAAATTLRIATAAAGVLGRSAPAAWNRIASGLVLLFDKQRGIHPEFRAYQGQLVKQADVTMLQYPWGRAMPAAVAQRDLNYYVPRSDPSGPSMSDAINNIDTAALGSPGCAAYVYTQRSIQPFMRDVFDQFSETNTGGAFTFMTGIGGFLQEFLYGYSGLRMQPHAVALDPLISSQLRGVVLHRLTWHGRHFTVSIGRSTTVVTLDNGAPMTVMVRGHQHRLAAGSPVSIPTRRPDLQATGDLVRCAAAQASSAARGAIPLAAVDGSPATDWQPTALPAQLTVPLGGARSVSHATLMWGRMWPPAPAPNVPPPPGPVQTLRPTDYRLLVSTDGHTWKTVAHVQVTTNQVRDVLSFPAVSARFVAVRMTQAASGRPLPMLDELTVR